MDWLGLWTKWTGFEEWTEWTDWNCGLNELTRTVDLMGWLELWVGLDRTVD